MKYCIFAIALLLGFPGIVMARQAHVCTLIVSMPFPGQAPDNAPVPTAWITDNTKFSCPSLGKKTIPELAADGWQISLPTSDAMPASKEVLMILIQKP